MFSVQRLWMLLLSLIVIVCGIFDQVDDVHSEIKLDLIHFQYLVHIFVRVSNHKKW